MEEESLESKIKASIENILRNTAISSGNTIVISGILVSLITGKILGLIFSGGVIVNALLNVFFKESLHFFFPDTKILKRPEISKKGCGVTVKCLPNAIPNPDEQGMPSGHSQTATFSATFWILYIWRYLRHTKNYNSYMLWPATILLSLLAILIIISRSFLVENCHTILQIIFGGAIGVSFAFLVYWLIEKFIPSWLGEPLKTDEKKK